VLRGAQLAILAAFLVLSQPGCALRMLLWPAGLAATLWAGLIGRRANSPPQLGQRLSANRSSTQDAQKVHSKEQIIASEDSGGSSLPQHSQFGLNSRAIAVSIWTRQK